GSCRTTPEQCSQAESALYLLLWRQVVISGVVMRTPPAGSSSHWTSQGCSCGSRAEVGRVDRGKIRQPTGNKVGRQRGRTWQMNCGREEVRFPPKFTRRSHAFMRGRSHDRGYCR